VATPLGNLETSPARGRHADAGGGRRCRGHAPHQALLAHVGSRAELISFHAHSSDAALRRILHLLASGKDVALVTDAGRRR